MYAPGRAGPEQELDSRQEDQHLDTFSLDGEAADIAPPISPEEEGLAEGATPKPGLASNAGERRFPLRERIPVVPYSPSAYLAEAKITEPATYEAAVNGPQAEEWRQAMDAEFTALLATGTFELVSARPGVRPLPCKWV